MKLEPPTIEKGIPVPIKRKNIDERYEERIAKMEIGDSFLVPSKHKHSAIRCIERAFGKGTTAFRVADLEFTRVWRIK